MLITMKNSIRLAVVLAAGTALSGCIVVPAGHRYGGGGAVVVNGGGQGVVVSDGELINVAPPQAQVEVVVAPPGPGYFWINGYWNWIGGRHVWVGGRWEAHRQGYQWAPHQWRREGNGWRMAPGRWERR
jgi:hypothetical protein